MPQLASILIADGKATPVNHTFMPKRVEDGIRAYLEEAVGIPLLRNTLQITVRPPVGNSQFYRATIKLALPLSRLDANAQAKMIATNTVGIDFVIHQESLQSEIDDAFAYAKNVLGVALVVDAVKTLTPLY